MIPRILIVSDTTGAQTKGLAARLDRRGAVVATAPARRGGVRHEQPERPIDPGLRRHPAGRCACPLHRRRVVRSDHAAPRRIACTGEASVPVWNSAQAIERCVDKSMTTFLLQNARLPTPPTFAAEGRAAAEAVAARELALTPLVLKPLFGAQGRGIRLIKVLSDLPEEDEVSGVLYLQHYVSRPGPPFRDFRVFVCAGRIVAMMSRRGDNWITNVSRGAMPEQVCEHSAVELSELAIAAAASVGADFAGVDIVAAADGSLLVLEVNSMPAWSGLQSVVAVNIADAIADSLLAFLTARTAASPPPYRFVVPANS